ncbi:MAG: hypothetical protein K0U74_12040 [Alphaproteobacteria bacterium]|nr:hypothetical protein [Alphaproteobacteria bacterium]
MLTRIHIHIIVTLVTITWVVTLLVRGITPSLDLLLPYGIAVGVVVSAVALFDQVLWRHPLLNKWIARRPYLHGTWRAHLVSDYVIDQEAGQTVAPITGYMVIYQTYSSLSVRLYTEKSSSAQISHAINSTNGEQFKVVTVYQNDPGVGQRGDTSEIHYGAFLLEATGLNPERLDGHYWTDRLTTGALTLCDRQSQTVAGFEEARRLFNNT